MTPRIDIVGGGILVAIALGSLYQAADLDMGSLRSFGPGMLPTILATLLLGAGAALLAIGIVQRGPAVEYLRVTWRGPLLVGLAILVFALTIEGMDERVLVVPQLGLAVAGPVTVLLAGHAALAASTRDLLAVGFGLTAFCLALFNDALGMDIPVVPGLAEGFLIDNVGTNATLRTVYLLWALVTIGLVVARPRAP